LFVAPGGAKGSAILSNARFVETSFGLKVVTGFTCDPHGRLLLEADPSCGWPEAVAVQSLASGGRVTDARPKRLGGAGNANTKAWGLFLGRRRLHRCRQENCWRTHAITNTGSAIVRDAGSVAEARPQSQVEDKSCREGKPNGCALLLLAVAASGVLRAVLLTSPGTGLPCWACPPAHFLGAAAGTDRQVGAAA